MDPRAVLVALEKRNYCISRKLNPRLSVSEASNVLFYLSQFGAFCLRIILAHPESGRMKPLFRGILLLLLKKLQFWLAEGGGGGGVHGREQYIEVVSWNSGEVS